MRPPSNLISDNESKHVEFHSGELLYALWGKEILNEHPELRVHERMLSDCIEFLIDESKEYMDEELTWSSFKDDVFNAIKDYPMAGILEDTMDELVETAPYNILKAWIQYDNNQELIIQSNVYKNACLYVIHSKKVDSYIEVNPK